MKAIVTGITGQDGACLTQLLLEKDYTVSEISRCTRAVNVRREGCRMMSEAGVHRNEQRFSF